MNTNLTELVTVASIKSGDVIIFNGERHTVTKNFETSRPGSWWIVCDTIDIRRRFDARIEKVTE